ncbi:ABC transporter permease [Actinokineospora sp. HUAS TT18]|uniref:ABC transporter permease n=1 Tax=Actinokineospora sp. HUAS TT18 TaxID=3447451 RepID=UPI003F520BD1
MSGRTGALVVVVAVAGALIAALLGVLTFGAQATSRPDAVPLAVVAPKAVADQLAQRGGDAVDWRVETADGARRLLVDKEVYGILELGQSGTRIVLSGAVNPQGQQVAQQVLTGVAQAMGGAVAVETLHPAGTAARTVPLAASALLWIGALVATIGLAFAAGRRGLLVRPVHRVGLVVAVAVVAPGVVVGLTGWWDSSVAVSWGVVGFLVLTAVAFAALQGALVRFLGIRAAAILGPLYLIAPAVAGQVPEMLNPAYRALLWSWTPFRFSAEGLRSLLQDTASAPDVRLGLIVLGSIAVVGLALLLLPARAKPTAAPADDAPVMVAA